jgi:hypothetical protein
MRELAFRMGLHAASPAATLNRTYIASGNYIDVVQYTSAHASSISRHERWRDNATVAAMLRADVDSWTQRAEFHGHQRLLVYRTAAPMAAAAALVGLAGVLAVLPLYSGWWALGRAPSLNPLETGVAMGAPLLSQPLTVIENACSGNVGQHHLGPQKQLQQQQRQLKRMVNSNAGHASIEAIVGPARVRYCAIPASEDKTDDEPGTWNDTEIGAAAAAAAIDAEADWVAAPFEAPVTARPPLALQQQAQWPEQEQEQEQGQQFGLGNEEDMEMMGSVGKEKTKQRLLLVDEQWMLSNGVKMNAPRKGERFI